MAYADASHLCFCTTVEHAAKIHQLRLFRISDFYILLHLQVAGEGGRQIRNIRNLRAALAQHTLSIGTPLVHILERDGGGGGKQRRKEEESSREPKS